MSVRSAVHTDMWLFSIMIYTDWPCALSSPRLDKCAIINPHYYYHYFSIKPECIVTTNPDRSVLVTIITWHSQLHLVNVSILLVRYEYGVRSESRYACYSHRYVTRCPLTTDDALVIFYLMPLISACLNRLTGILPLWNILTLSQEHPLVCRKWMLLPAHS